MKRRGFLKSLLGLAAASTVPASACELTSRKGPATFVSNGGVLTRFTWLGEPVYRKDGPIMFDPRVTPAYSMAPRYYLKDGTELKALRGIEISSPTTELFREL